MLFLPTFFLKVHLLCTNDDFEACLGIPMVSLLVHWTTVRGVHVHIATFCTKSNSVLTFLHKKWDASNPVVILNDTCTNRVRRSIV